MATTRSHCSWPLADSYSADARIGRENIAFARSLGLTNALFTGSQVIFSPVRTAMSQRRLMMSLRTASAMLKPASCGP